MQYFYKKSYASGAGSLSLEEAGEHTNEQSIASVAQSLGARVLSVDPAEHTILLELNDEEKTAIEETTGVELFPNYQYSPAIFVDDVSLLSAATTPIDAAGPNKFSFVVEGTDGQKLVDARVVVRLSPGVSASALSGQDGEVNFSLRDPEISDVQVYPKENYWCASVAGGKASESESVRKLLLEPLELPFKDSLGHFYPEREANVGAGVKVAIIDTGVNAHEDLPPISVQRTVLNGTVSDGCVDSSANHGTHVAGIVAGKRFGIAPGVTLLGYSVFPKDRPTAGTIDIATAIDHAVSDGADIINLSLGMNKHDAVIAAAIANAVDEGVFVVAATGNDGMAQVSFPARLEDVYAVGAVGLRDAFAATSTHRLIGVREENEAKVYVANFSNFAHGKVDGAAPGVAVVSTVCTSGYQAKSGTSMASPVVSAIAAGLLAKSPEVLSLTGRKRVEELRELLYNGSQKHDLNPQYVGVGVPS